MHQPPVRQQCLDRLRRTPGLPDRGPTDQQHEPAPLSRGRHPGPDPGPGGIHIPRHVLRQALAGHPRHADRRMHSQPPRVRLARPHRPRRTRHPGIQGGVPRPCRVARPSDTEGGQLASDHGGELLRRPAAQVDVGHIRQQPGKGRVIKPGRQHICPPFPYRPGQRGTALVPGPVPGGVLGRHEYHDRRGLLAVDGWQFLSQVLAPQLDFLVGVIKVAHSPRLQRLGDLPDVVPLRACERQCHMPPPPRPHTWVRNAVNSRHDIESPTDRRRRPVPPH